MTISLKLVAAAFIVVFVFAAFTYTSTRGRVETRIHDCALVMTRSGSECR